VGYDLDTQQILGCFACPTVGQKFLRRVQAATWNRHLVLTGGTLIADESEKTPPLLALVPATVQKGDVICILYGCSVPVVLWRRAANPTTNGFPRLRFTQPTQVNQDQ